MIGHELHRSGSFWSFLLSIDKDLADSTRQRGCPWGGRLHSANYPRAPRVGPDHLPDELSTLFGVDRATVARWQAFWRDCIPQTPFWKLARGRVVPLVEIAVLPLSLLEAFHRTKDPCQDWGSLLRFLSPLTVPSSPLIKMA
jgi:hypothetical protein